MKNKSTSYLIGILTVMALAGFLYVAVHAVFYAPEAEVPLPPGLKVVDVSNSSYQEKKVGDEVPVRLRIPSIHVDALIQAVGITRKGNMSTPTNFTDVGWYKYGVAPGENGSAVIAGHVDNGLSLPAVFSNLNDLHVGDNIYIEMSGGSELHFIVTEADTYDYNAPTNDVFTDSGSPQVRLITCAGTWIQELRTHNKRLVVTAALQNS